MSRKRYYAYLKIGDVVVNSRNGRRYEVVGWSPRGKLRMRRESGSFMDCWWTYLSSPPKYFHVERDGVRVR